MSDQWPEEVYVFDSEEPVGSREDWENDLADTYEPPEERWYDTVDFTGEYEEDSP